MLSRVIAKNVGDVFLRHSVVRSQLLNGFQDTGKRTQLSRLCVPAWLTVILSSE